MVLESVSLTATFESRSRKLCSLRSDTFVPSDAEYKFDPGFLASTPAPVPSDVILEVFTDKEIAKELARSQDAVTSRVVYGGSRAAWTRNFRHNGSCQSPAGCGGIGIGANETTVRAERNVMVKDMVAILV